LQALSLFSGAGGLDLGLERAGFDVVGCVESDLDCRETLKQNRPGWRLLDAGDIHQHRPSDLLSSFGLSRREVALLVGGPPCQPFSKSGQWKADSALRMQDPRARTVHAFLDVLEAVLPDVMLLENVNGITATRTHVTQRYEGLDVVRSGLNRINRRRGTRYTAVPLVLDAAEYGVPQHRRRAFIFASRDGDDLGRPTPTRGVDAAAGGNTDPDDKRFATSWDALWDLDDPDFDRALLPTGKWADLLASIPEGSNYLHHTQRGEGIPIFGWRRRYWSFLLKLAKARPSWTVQAQPGSATGPFHWRSRRLSSQELARLQSFPDDWAVAGALTSVRRQLGNAVPPPLGEAVGHEIRRRVFGESPRRKAPLTPAPRHDCPDPEPLGPAPEQFLALCGDHAEHPGAGSGPAARA
jgi:DNA (cytosine-5)-methyltransferase 1